MKQPFRRSNADEVILDKNGNPIPIFSASKFASCDWNHYRDIVDPLPITDELSDIFDGGNEVHREEEYLRKGARNVLECEEYMRIVHESERWGVAGLLDYDKLSFRGAYIEDLKTTKRGGFYFFLKEGVKKDNKIQISVYGFMKYVCTGVTRTKGVITKIDRDEPLNRLSLATDLFTIDEICEFLVKHPVIKTVLGEMTPQQLAEICVRKMRPEVNASTGEHWRCTNCQYADGSCPVRQAL